LRGRLGAGIMPRVVNWVTGPSRTADIEQTLLLGAHGPRRLHILLVDGDGRR
jgi:L-lactate dehydrogenase complex protein LldG